MHTSVVLILVETLNSLMDNKDMFTCFDVTRILRDKRSCSVDHQEVRELIHSLSGTDLPPFKGRGYVRNSMVPLGRFGHAEVYAPQGTCALGYDPGALDPNKPVVASPAAQAQVQSVLRSAGLASGQVLGKLNAPAAKAPAAKAPAKAVQSGGDPAPRSKRSTKIDAKRMVTCRDQRGRVTIHNGFIRDAGLRTGSTAFVAKRNGGAKGLVVMDRSPKTGLLATYVVDKSGNVRITKKVLRKSGLKGVKSLKMRLADNRRAVVLTPA